MTTPTFSSIRSDLGVPEPFYERKNKPALKKSFVCFNFKTCGCTQQYESVDPLKRSQRMYVPSFSLIPWHLHSPESNYERKNKPALNYTHKVRTPLPIDSQLKWVYTRTGYLSWTVSTVEKYLTNCQLNCINSSKIFGRISAEMNLLRWNFSPLVQLNWLYSS